jgi:hypothetical protein
MLLSSLVLGSTWYVKPDGTGDVPTIQAGIDSAASGDTVLLAGGTFHGTGNHNILVSGGPILIKSETGDPQDCIIDCDGYLGPGRYGFRFQSEAFLSGITVMNGNVMDNGGAVYCESSTTIRDCVFLSNQSAYWGGAVCFYSSGYPVLKNCTFALNMAGDWGGAITIQGIELDVTIDSCTFYDNHATSGGAILCYMHEASATILNSVFYQNSATVRGGALHVDDMSTSTIGCTFNANSAPVGSAISTFTTLHVDNCIIANGTGGEGYYYSESTMLDPSISCTDIYGNEGGNWVGRLTNKLGLDGNFSGDPAFCDAEIEPYDLRLCNDSPCLLGNHPDGYNCGLIGALGQGCICDPTGATASTWSAIKSMYR